MKAVIQFINDYGHIEYFTENNGFSRSLQQAKVMPLKEAEFTAGLNRRNTLVPPIWKSAKAIPVKIVIE